MLINNAQGAIMFIFMLCLFMDIIIFWWWPVLI